MSIIATKISVNNVHLPLRKVAQSGLMKPFPYT